MADERRLRAIVGLGILFAWLASLTDGIATMDYHAFDVSTPVMVIYASFFFSDRWLSKRLNGDER